MKTQKQLEYEERMNNRIIQYAKEVLEHVEEYLSGSNTEEFLLTKYLNYVDELKDPGKKLEICEYFRGKTFEHFKRFKNMSTEMELTYDQKINFSRHTINKIFGYWLHKAMFRYTPEILKNLLGANWR